MFFKINPHNGVPVYEQVYRQIAFAIADGGLRPGEMIPSVRSLAKTLAINPNTVARAYRQLQDDSIVEAVRGTGLEISEKAVGLCRAERIKIVRQAFSEVIVAARQSRLTDREIKEILEDEILNTRKGK